MESGLSGEYQLPKPELAKGRIDSLYEQLGFIETEELKLIREQAIQASSAPDPENRRALLAEYQLTGEELVNSLHDTEYMRAQIGLIVAKATLHRDMGDIEAFMNNIGDAKEYAYNAYLDDVVAVLEKAPSVEIARLLSSLGEEFGFDDETVAEISVEPYGQAFEMAYSYLTQAGLDADEILSVFMDQDL